MDNLKPAETPDSDPSRMVFISTRQEIPKPKSIPDPAPKTHIPIRQDIPQPKSIEEQPHTETQAAAAPTRDYLTEIVWALTIARNLASECGRDALAQDIQDQIQALEGTDEEF